MKRYQGGSMTGGPGGGPKHGQSFAGRNPSYQDGRAESEMGDPSGYLPKQPRGQPSRGRGHQMTAGDGAGGAPEASDREDGSGMSSGYSQQQDASDGGGGSARRVMKNGVMSSKRTASQGAHQASDRDTAPRYQRQGGRNGPGHGTSHLNRADSDVAQLTAMLRNIRMSRGRK